MKKIRTPRQMEANKIDIDMFNLVMRLDLFAQRHARPEVAHMAILLDDMRDTIRQHMHPSDVKATQ